MRVRSLIALDERGERSSAFGHALDQLSLRAREVTGVLEPCAPRPAGLRSNFGRGWQFLSSLCCDSLWPRPCNRIRTPDLLIQPTEDKRLPWRILHQGIDIARFDDIGKAGAYVAFMRGATVEPRTFQ